MSDWVPDVLGDEFEQRTLPLGSDDEGDVVATLVRALPATPSAAPNGWDRFMRRLRGRAVDDPPPMLDGVDVLYVHGWSDYFFQKRLARFWTARGARFYALDLRKYGRSLRDGQTPGYITDLVTYDEDIAAALDVMGADAAASPGGRRLVLLGHSTGGLVLSLWASRHPGRADAVVLNSPWLEFQLGAVRTAILPVVELGARWRPHDAAPQVDLGFYARAQAEVADPDDPMDVNHEWRPEHAMTVSCRLAERHPRGAHEGGCGTRDRRTGVRTAVDSIAAADALVQRAHLGGHGARRRRDRAPGAEAGFNSDGGAHRRGAARRVPVAQARARRCLRTAGALGRRVGG